MWNENDIMTVRFLNREASREFYKKYQDKEEFRNYKDENEVFNLKESFCLDIIKKYDEKEIDNEKTSESVKLEIPQEEDNDKYQAIKSSFKLRFGRILGVGLIDAPAFYEFILDLNKDGQQRDNDTLVSIINELNKEFNLKMTKKHLLDRQNIRVVKSSQKTNSENISRIKRALQTSNLDFLDLCGIDISIFKKYYCVAASMLDKHKNKIFSEQLMAERTKDYMDVIKVLDISDNDKNYIIGSLKEFIYSNKDLYGINSLIKILEGMEQKKENVEENFTDLNKANDESEIIEEPKFSKDSDSEGDFEFVKDDYYIDFTDVEFEKPDVEVEENLSYVVVDKKKAGTKLEKKKYIYATIASAGIISTLVSTFVFKNNPVSVVKSVTTAFESIGNNNPSLKDLFLSLGNLTTYFGGAIAGYVGASKFANTFDEKKSSVKENSSDIKHSAENSTELEANDIIISDISEDDIEELEFDDKTK